MTTSARFELIRVRVGRNFNMYPDVWRREVEASLCRLKAASRSRDMRYREPTGASVFACGARAQIE
jgi:hypothetical protein